METIEFDEIADQPCPEGWEFTRGNVYRVSRWSHIWHPVKYTDAAVRCVLLARKDRKYYATPIGADEFIGPYDTLAEACAVADFLLR